MLSPSASPVNTLLTLTVLVGVLVVALVVGGWFLTTALNPEPTRSQARLIAIVGDSEEKQSAFGRWLQKQTTEQSGPPKGLLGSVLKSIIRKGNLDTLIEHAGLKISPYKYAMQAVLLPALSGLALLWLTHNIAFVLVMIVGPAMGWGYLKWKALKRLGLLEAQLPDALNVLASSLRAGHSFQSAMNLLAEQLPDPIIIVFTNLHNDMKLGVPAKESLTKLIDDVPLADYRIFSTAVLVQRDVGGNLAEVMDRLSYTIRERFKLKRQVTVLTSQPRLSAYILGAGPLVLFGIFYFFFNSYLEPLYTNIFGQIAMVVAFLMELVGFYIMWKIVDIKY